MADESASMFAGQPQPVEIHHRGHLVLRRADRLAPRGRRPGRRPGALPRRRPAALDLEGPGRPAPARPQAPAARGAVPGRGAPAGPGRPPEDEDDATRPHALLAAMRGSRPAKPAHATTPPRPPRPAPAARRRPRAGRRADGRATALPAARPPLGLPQRRLTRRGQPARRAARSRRRGRSSSTRRPRPRGRCGRAGSRATTRRRHPARRPRWRRCRPSVSESATTVTEATPAGGRPVRASTTCCPRWALPTWPPPRSPTGTTATSRRGSRGSSMPIRHGGPSGSTVRQTMSPPADRQKSVPGSARSGSAARSAAQPFTTPLGSRTTRAVGPRAVDAERAAGAPARLLPQREHLGDLGRAVGEGRARRGPAGRRRSRAGRC